MPGAVLERPALAALAGAVCIAFSAILVRLAEVEPSTAAVFRCAYAVPVLWLIARWEDRRFGPRARRDRRFAAGAGVFFAVDLIAWHHAIENVGAGLGTVLANLQVVLVAFAAWVVLGERPGARVIAAVPVVFCGVVLVSGALEEGAYGRDPALGVVFGVVTSIAYAGFILVLRRGGRDDRRPAGPLGDATAVATVCAVLAGWALGEVDLAPSWPAHGWLVTLALTSQVLGWLFIGGALPRLPAALASVLIMVQPVGAVLLGAVLLDEAPSALQLAGVAVILGAVVLATSSRRRPAAAPAPA